MASVLDQSDAYLSHFPDVESKITSLFAAAETGDGAATDALFSALYSELHRMAKRELARHGAPPSLSVTTL